MILVHDVRYITTETKEVTRIGYNGLLFSHLYSGRKGNPLYPIRAASFWFNSTVSYTCSIPYITTLVRSDPYSQRQS